MDTVRDIAYALVVRMSNRKVISLNRLVKLIYLVDWSATLNHAYKIPNLNWRNDICGPNDPIIVATLEKEKTILRVGNRYDDSEIVDVSVRVDDYEPKLSPEVDLAIQHIQRIASNLPWEKLSLLVSSTYPVLISSIGDMIDLPKLAEEYKGVVQKSSNDK